MDKFVRKSGKRPLDQDVDDHRSHSEVAEEERRFLSSVNSDNQVCYCQFCRLLLLVLIVFVILLYSVYCINLSVRRRSATPFYWPFDLDTGA